MYVRLFWVYKDFMCFRWILFLECLRGLDQELCNFVLDDWEGGGVEDIYIDVYFRVYGNEDF